MTKIKEKDFVEIDYEGRIKETENIFDLTSEEDAKKEKIHSPDYKYGTRVICVGQKQLLPKLDEALVGKEEHSEFKIEISPKEGFGLRDSSLIKTVATSTLTKQKINPFPGLQISAGGMLGTVRSVSVGRTTIDFNHPLAGRNLLYKIKVGKIVTNDKEKLRGLLKTELNLTEKEYENKEEGNKVELKLKPKIPKEIREKFIEKTKNLIPSLEITFS